MAGERRKGGLDTQDGQEQKGGGAKYEDRGEWWRGTVPHAHVPLVPVQTSPGGFNVPDSRIESRGWALPGRALVSVGTTDNPAGPNRGGPVAVPPSPG